MTQWKVTVDGKEFNLVKDDGKFQVDGNPAEADAVRIRGNELHIIRDGKSYTAEVIEFFPKEKKLTLKVNGNEYVVDIKDKLDILLQQMGMTKRAAAALGNLAAPMPGKVLRVDVTEGQPLKKGEPVLILEAMKMENTIKSPGNGTVKRVLVKQGDAVEKGTVMVEMADALIR